MSSAPWATWKVGPPIARGPIEELAWTASALDARAYAEHEVGHALTWTWRDDLAGWIAIAGRVAYLVVLRQPPVAYVTIRLARRRLEATVAAEVRDGDA